MAKSKRKTSRSNTQYSGLPLEEILPKTNAVSMEDLLASLSRSKLKDLVAERMASTGAKRTLKPKLETLSILDLVVDSAYQRLPNETEIQLIVGGFDNRYVGLPKVARRNYNGGELAIIDAQQRVLSTYLTGFDRILCEVVDVDSVEDEARAFHGLNVDRRTVPSPVKHRNNVLLGNEFSRQLEGAVRAAGMEFSQTNGNGKIKGVDRLARIVQIYQVGDEPNWGLLTEAILAYAAIWPEHKLVHTYILGGLSALIFAYGHTPWDPESATPELVAPNVLAEKLQRWYYPQENITKFRDAKGKEKIRRRWKQGYDILREEVEKGKIHDTYRAEADASYALHIAEKFNRYLKTAGTTRLPAPKRQFTRLRNYLDGKDASLKGHQAARYTK